MQSLHATLSDPDATDDQLRAKVQALRDARAAAQAEVDEAEAELRQGLTPRQEAVLMARGLLD